IARMATDPETVRSARVHLAAAAMRQGNHAGAIEALESIIKESKRPDTLASAAVYKGQSHLGLKQWDQAVLSFLQVPVFYPEQKALLPASLLGSGQALFGLSDLDRAKATFNELLSTYGATREAAAARAELEKIAHYEKAHELTP
ncbi:MAG: tetratricopeptide repeat protein, partial [Verrucomicrobiota bacterium]|nr:tetratricopeptide repeat protein [Verrucomicrobiota bacterium]